MAVRMTLAVCLVAFEVTAAEVSLALCVRKLLRGRVAAQLVLITPMAPRF
jgi:hypothetical protein